MTARRCFTLFLLALGVGCGDRVLGGTAGACASYAKGSLVERDVSVAAYCTAFETICGIGELPGRAPLYTSLADCETKYGAETSAQRSCSAGNLCEAQASGASSSCSAALVCDP